MPDDITTPNPNPNPATPGTPTAGEDPAAIYARQLADLQNNSVPREQYEAMRRERDTLATSLASRTFSPEEKAPQKTVDRDALRKKIFSPNVSNIEFTEAVLELRDDYLREDPTHDIYAGWGATDQDIPYRAYEDAQKLADVQRACLKEAAGDNKRFTALFNSHLIQPATAGVYNNRR
jgi:hypothetical protein